MCGLLGWLGFTTIANTRVISHLLRLPLRVDPLDIKPFEAIGRQSLVIAFAFIGGNTLALLLGNYASAAGDPRFWLLFGPFFLLPVVVFFLNMIPTQRVLSQAKNGELAAVQGELHAVFRLAARTPAGGGADRQPVPGCRCACLCVRAASERSQLVALQSRHSSHLDLRRPGADHDRTGPQGLRGVHSVGSAAVGMEAVLSSQRIVGIFRFQELSHLCDWQVASVSSSPTPIERWLCTIFQQPFS